MAYKNGKPYKVYTVCKFSCTVSAEDFSLFDNYRMQSAHDI